MPIDFFTRQVNLPSTVEAILADPLTQSFGMASDTRVGALLRVLAGSKPSGRCLDLGTGTGLSAAWLLDGLDEHGNCLSMDNDSSLLNVANQHLGQDSRLKLVCSDGDDFVRELSQQNQRFDLIFADTWAGKYRLLDETLALLNPSGLYIIDDMLPQPNWPEDHAPKAQALMSTLHARTDLAVLTLDWACGLVLAVKRGEA